MFFVEKNATSVNETVLEADSPPLTSSLHSRKSASSAQESAYLRRSSTLRWLRLGISGLIICVAITIVGCSGHVLHSYNRSHLNADWFLVLWPADVDLKPTLGTMIPAAIVVALGVLYMLFAIIPSPRSRNLYQVLLFIFTSGVAFVVTTSSVFFHQLVLYHFDANNRETLQTWTCKFYYGAQDFKRNTTGQQTQLTDDQLIPVGFKRLCMESMTGQWLTIVLLAIELLCCFVAIHGFKIERDIKKSRQMRHQDGKCESEFE